VDGSLHKAMYISHLIWSYIPQDLVLAWWEWLS